MKSLTCFLFVCSLMAAMAPTPASGSDITIPNTFQSGTPAVAAEVNANFTAVESAVDDNDSRIAALESAVSALQATVASQASTIATLQNNLAAVQSSQVMALDPYLTVDAASDPRGPLVQLAGVNLQIVNGLGDTETINGLGNLIIGYDEVNTLPDITVCSDGDYTDQASCEGAGEIWSNSHKSGSHYLVVGSQNNYSQYGGLVAGYRNFVTSDYSTVNGGAENLARGSFSSVSAGYRNKATGSQSSVSAGYRNTAAGSQSSVSGGIANTASGNQSSVSGGASNTASGSQSSVSGGVSNTASGTYSSVSGGYSRSVSGTTDWRAGTLFEDN